MIAICCHSDRLVRRVCALHRNSVGSAYHSCLQLRPWRLSRTDNAIQLFLFRPRLVGFDFPLPLRPETAPLIASSARSLT